mmetsp:Transcript_22691/g.68215  ORF Transcript_22691/g.68215 Transcript_22691/m.68215 type:complete len:210 (-) Transcript_22691:296-925(-)
MGRRGLRGRAELCAQAVPFLNAWDGLLGQSKKSHVDAMLARDPGRLGSNRTRLRAQVRRPFAAAGDLLERIPRPRTATWPCSCGLRAAPNGQAPARQQRGGRGRRARRVLASDCSEVKATAAKRQSPPLGDAQQHVPPTDLARHILVADLHEDISRDDQTAQTQRKCVGIRLGLRLGSADYGGGGPRYERAADPIAPVGGLEVPLRLPV